METIPKTELTKEEVEPRLERLFECSVVERYALLHAWHLPGFITKYTKIEGGSATVASRVLQGIGQLDSPQIQEVYNHIMTWPMWEGIPEPD